MIRTVIFRAFLNRYFPYTPPRQPTAPTAKADAARVAGWYESSRRNDSALRMLYLLGQVSVSAQPDGTVTVSALKDYAGNPLQWRETGPLQYTETNVGKSHLAFITDHARGIRYFATDAEVPVFVFQPVSTARSMGTAVPLLVASTLVALVALLLWWLGPWMRRHYRRPLELGAGQRRTRLFSRLGALSLVVPVFGWLGLLAAVSSDMTLLLTGEIVPWMVVLYVLGVVASLGVLAIIANAVRVWMAPRRSRWVLAGETLLGLAAVYAIWFIVAFGLVSFNTHY